MIISNSLRYISGIIVYRPLDRLYTLMNGPLAAGMLPSSVQGCIYSVSVNNDAGYVTYSLVTG